METKTRQKQIKMKTIAKQEKVKSLLISQEHPLGCAVACVASQCGLTYSDAHRLFVKAELAWTRGYYCSEVVKALKNAKFNYTYEEFDFSLHADQLKYPGTIVFVDPNHKYPSGHYLLRTETGWMNPWSNFPSMKPVQASIEKFLPGEVTYIVYSVNK